MAPNTANAAVTNVPANSSSVLPENRQAGRMWGAGGHAYDRISRQIADAIEHAVDRLDPRPSEHILDVGTGTGWTARRAAVRGARVSGVDIGEEVIEAAREMSPPEIDFQVGDAEALPYPDGHFDGVISTFGVMFAGNPERAAAELIRVCRPGGRLSLATWATDGSVLKMFTLIKSFRPPEPPKPSPFAWGDTQRLVDLLGDGYDLGFEDGACYYREPDAESAWNAFREGFGPVATLAESMDAERLQAFRDAFVAFHEGYRTGAGVLVPREYVITVGRRR